MPGSAAARPPNSGDPARLAALAGMEDKSVFSGVNAPVEIINCARNAENRHCRPNTSATELSQRARAPPMCRRRRMTESTRIPLSTIELDDTRNWDEPRKRSDFCRSPGKSSRSFRVPENSGRCVNSQGEDSDFRIRFENRCAVTCGIMRTSSVAWWPLRPSTTSRSPTPRPSSNCSAWGSLGPGSRCAPIYPGWSYRPGRTGSDQSVVRLGP